MQFFTKYIIGGKTGKRETAWLVFLLFTIGVVWMGWREVHGFSVEAIKEILKAALWPAFALLGYAYGMEWWSHHKNPSGYSDGESFPEEPTFDEFEGGNNHGS